MVNYDWKCRDCGKVFEQQAASDTKTLVGGCSKCGGPCNRLSSAPAFKVTGGTPKFHKGGR